MTESEWDPEKYQRKILQVVANEAPLPARKRSAKDSARGNGSASDAARFGPW